MQPRRIAERIHDAADSEVRVLFGPLDKHLRAATGNLISVPFARAIHLRARRQISPESLADRRIVFSGDLGRPHDTLQPPPERARAADSLVIESTYGDRLHEPEDVETTLGQVIKRTAARGGVVVMPAFAVGRAQALLYAIEGLVILGFAVTYVEREEHRSLHFTTLGALGLYQIVQRPAVLAAVNPLYGVEFFARNGWPGYLVLGSVFLVVTGGEALYADMGHFGKKPIRFTWFALVMPALMLNYFGQGALILGNPEAIEHPFFLMAPQWALYPLVALSTAATVIASQAVISGAFSLTRQAVQLGYLPRLRIEHTSERQIGQIYIPSINWLLMIACIGLVLGFRSSTNLAAAYGVAVTTDMVFTTILFAFVARSRFGWAPWKVGLLAAGFLVVDLGFWGANIVKIPKGGWFPLVIAAAFFTAMTTWKMGRQILADRLQDRTLPIKLFLADLEANRFTRVAGTAVYMYGNPEGTPPALLHNLIHNKVLHERVVLLTVETEEIPTVEDSDRVEVSELGHGLFRVVLRYGFTDDPDIPSGLALTKKKGLVFKPMETSYFLGRETLIASKTPGMAMWREHIFAVMSRNARSATSFFGLPPNRVVELGAQIEL